MKTKATTITLSMASLLLPAVSLLAPVASAQTQSVVYCCDDAAGRKTCGDFLPKECQKRAWEERDNKGFIVRKQEAPLTAEQQAKRDAELTKKAQLAQKQLEDRRRNQALLSTYASEQDIDKARDRALADSDKAIAQAEKALADSVNEQKATDKEKEFYVGKPLPAQLKKQIEMIEKGLATKTDALAKRKQDKERVAAEFENEKMRFRELTGGKTGVQVDDKPKREVIIQPPAQATTPTAPATATPAVAPPAGVALPATNAPPASGAAPAAKP